MKDRGWTYSPVDVAEPPPEDDLKITDPSEYGRQFGFGIAQDYVQNELPTLLGVQVSEPEDPNLAFVLGLSESEQLQYRRDLTGVDESGEPLVSEEKGCSPLAWETIFGDEGIDDPTIPYEFGRIYKSNPTMVAAASEWHDCMARLSELYTWKWPDDLNLELLVEKERLLGRVLVDATGAPIDVTSVQPGTAFSFASDGQPKPIPQDKLDRFQDREIKLWAADQSCRKSSKFDETFDQLERDFVASYDGGPAAT